MCVDQPLALPGSAKYINVTVRPGRVVGNYILSGMVYLGDVKPLCPFRERFETRTKTHPKFGQINIKFSFI